MMWRMTTADHPMEAHRLESRFLASTGQSADAKEGVDSFLEKRAANFSLKVSEDMPEGFPWWDDPSYFKK